jgi:predicted NBD/HSP70 family sugar kinase
MPRGPVPVLEVGGTHVTAALVDLAAGHVVEGTRQRQLLDAGGAAADVIASLVGAARPIIAPIAPCWVLGVAIPGPFDYDRGVGRYEGVAKFEALNGLDVRDALRAGLRDMVTDVAFINDADAFVLGEWSFGAAAGHRRAAGITLGTGVGSGFVEDGHVVSDDARVPPDGSVHQLTIEGQPLEETVSRRALIRRARESVDELPPGADVIDIAVLARAGNRSALRVFDDAFLALGAALAPWLARFEATVLVVGGSITGSWDIIERPLVRGMELAEPALTRLLTRRAERPEDSALIGAAVHASDASSRSVRLTSRGRRAPHRSG